ncbi:hypothetical protein HAX54_029550 [Datura stramonium]|uniref:Uncharacterized protein n=1 Tax=Datura stramonium TaxID=4076 RepID=A0ABS8SAD0_DATST|nr:hypothetical protein [Datura stramonium]
MLQVSCHRLARLRTGILACNVVANEGIKRQKKLENEITQLIGRPTKLQKSEKKELCACEWLSMVTSEGREEERPLDFYEDNILDLDLPEVMEKYVLIASLCSHSQLYARPMMT